MIFEEATHAGAVWHGRTASLVERLMIADIVYKVK